MSAVRRGVPAAGRAVRAAGRAVRAARVQASGDAGTATAELAVSLPALVLLLTVGLVGLGAVRDQIECVAAAREIAVAHARGESPPPVSGATVEVSSDGDVVQVVVTRHRRPLGGAVPGFDVSATAVAAIEPGQ